MVQKISRFGLLTVIAMVVSVSMLPPGASASERRVMFPRGVCPIMCSKDYIGWTYGNNRISNSYAWQGSTYTFPMSVETKGISLTYASQGRHNYRGDKRFNSGVLTPWGSINLTSSWYSDSYAVIANGSAYRI